MSKRWRKMTVAATVLLAAAAGVLGLLSYADDEAAPGRAAGGPRHGNAGTAVATFAGGCFWCMEQPFDVLDGVIGTVSGYTGGHTVDPTYQEVSAGTTGHAEAVQITYDPTRVSYEELLRVFWRNIDPTTPNRQFCDGGTQYRSAIFYHDAEQARMARASKAELDASRPFKEPIVTEIVAAGTFYRAEDYHQDYYVSNPVRYKFYRYSCGRDDRLRMLWGAGDSRARLRNNEGRKTGLKIRPDPAAEKGLLANHPVRHTGAHG